MLEAVIVAQPVSASAGRWCRAGVLTPRGRVDLALPSDVPVAELVPMVLELIGEPTRPSGRGAAGKPVVPRSWRLTGPAGGPLPPDATLSGLGVLDGELLHLGPRSSAPPAPVFDDPADALAGAVRESGPGSVVRHAGAVAAVAVVTAASALLVSVRGAALPVLVVAVAAALLGAGAALLRCRTDPDAVDPGSAGSTDGADGTGDGDTTEVLPGAGASPAARAAALAAVPPAVAGVVLVLPGPLGAGQMLLGALAAGLAALLGLTLLRAVSPSVLTIAVAAPVLAAAAVVRLVSDAPVGAIAAGLTAVALATGPVLPRAALRVAGMPAPTVPSDLEEISRADTPPLPGPVMAARADLARALFAGLSAPAALLAAGGAIVAAAQDGWTGPVLAVVTVAVLLLRARAFAEAGPAQVLAAAAVATAIGAGVLASLNHGPVVRLVAAAALGLAVLVAVRTTAARMSPVGRRTLDVLELLLTAASIPAALAAMGLFALVRGL